MLLEIALYEFKYRVKRNSTWIYFLAIFLVSFLFMVSAAGGFPGKVIGGNTREWANSPFMIHELAVNINFVAVMVIAAIMGQAVYRDFDKKTWELFFTKPVTKSDYVFGRFIGSYAVVLFITTAIALGAWFGTLMPFVQQNMLGPNRLAAYLQPYLVSILPTNLMIGLVFSGLVLKTRKMTSVYIGSVVLFISYAIAQELLPDMGNKVFASLIDPFGFTAFLILTKYWTLADKNALLMPFTGLVFANRLLWITIGVGLFTWFYRGFSLLYDEKLPKKRKEDKKEEVESTLNFSALEKSKRDFGGRSLLASLVSEIKLELTLSFKNRYLLSIVAIGLLFLFAMSTVIGNRFGTPTLPVTFEMLEFVLRLYSLVILIAIIFLSGDMVWRARTNGIDQVADCSPLPTVSFYLSKLIALHLVVVALIALVIPSAILIQALRGYYNFKIGLYFFDLFVLNMAKFSFFIVLAFFVHILVNNKSMGHLLMVFYYLWAVIAPKLGFEHLLFVPMKLPNIIYSDMNGYGFFLQQWFWHAVSGFGWVVILVVLSALLWVRGVDTGSRERITRLKSGINPIHKWLMVTGVLILVGADVYILYNTNILNDYITKKSLQKSAYNYETNYKQYENLPQPSTTNVYSEVDIFPKEYRVKARGRFTLVNTHNVGIDSFVVSWPTRLLIFGNSPRGMEIEKLDFSTPAEQTISDKKQGFYLYTLAQTLQPGDSCYCDFEVQIRRRGFSNGRESTQLIKNGTFLNSYLLFPVFGYNRDKELQLPGVREKYGLPPRDRMVPINAENEYPLIPDRVEFETIVSTCGDQIAVAPGKKMDEWKEDGRNYYRYKSDTKIWEFFTFQSARYAVRSGQWENTPLAVYYHPEHDNNVDAMLDGIKSSLDYYSTVFSPFEESEVKVVEFPRYSSFALSMPNTIPFSEAIGFIANVNRESENFIDYPFFITAHEVAHHWWGGQLVAANVQGGLLIDESLAEYSAMMVLKKRYGKGQMRQLNRYKLNRYFEGRSMEVEEELPLFLMENQGYLHYEKGGLALYALQELIGEETMNRALVAFLKEYGYRDSNFPKSKDFIGYLRNETPDSLQGFITDTFEIITLYDMYLGDVKVNKDKTDYLATININASKFVADGYGNETPTTLNDWVDIEIQDNKGESLLNRRIHITGDRTEVKFRLKGEPAKVIIDPDYLYINKHFENNSVQVNTIYDDDSIKVISL